MPENRMDNQPPRPKPGGQTLGQGNPLAPDTKLEHGAATPEESDPLGEELGATRIVEGPSDSSLSGVNLDMPVNHTEMTSSRTLGKNLVNLGDFKLIKKLGEGAMGAVYKAAQVTFNGEKLDKPRTVALKVLFPHVANIPKLVERLHREGLVMGSLSHPNIVQAYAVDTAEGCHYVAMEYVSGQSLQKWLTQLGNIPVADAVRITLDCARALAYAHTFKIPDAGDGKEFPVVHRDIKPDNILLTKAGVVKVADLGMVKIDDEEMSLTQTGHAVGTPWYMPLEQARNAKEIDGRCDIYALGCTLYAMLTGRPPFMGRTIVEVIQAKEVGTFASARQSNPNVPERLDLLIAKMTAKSPRYRYQTCDELIKDLESVGLASEKLSFVQQRPAVDPRAQETPMPVKTGVLQTLAKSKIDSAEAPAPALDPTLWYIQLTKPDGSVTAQQYTTAQVQKMLAEGTMKPTARASHSPNDGFRALATYKEFQGTALSQMQKKAADKHSAKYRGIYKKIEQEDRQREKDERADHKEDSAVQANTRYWAGLALTVLPIGLGVGLIVVIFLLIRWMFQ